MEKRRWLALSVTTEEGLRQSLKDQCPVICVESPLYPQIKEHWFDFAGISEYDASEYETLQCVMLKKIRGAKVFDDSQFEIFYYPFHRL